MKTINQALDEAYINAGQNAYFGRGFNEGVQFAESWIPVEEELPEVVEPVNGVYDNNDLLLVKWKTHGSIEFAVLIEDFGVKAWDIPDNGIVPIDEISGWRPITRK